MTRSREFDDQVVEQAPGTSPEAFSAFYRRWERPMLGFFMRATGEPELAADLTAETFAVALETVTAFDPARGRPDQWLFGIARHVLGASRRRGRVDATARRRLGLPPLALEDHTLDSIARLAAQTGSTTGALEALPPEQRQAVELRVLEDLGYAEIAGELRCSEAVVRQRVSRGLRAMRTRLAGGE